MAEPIDLLGLAEGHTS